MTVAMLTANELADIAKCTVRTIQRKAKNGQLKSIVIKNELNIDQNMFAVEDLPTNLKERYMLLRTTEEQTDRDESNHLSKNEREQIAFWSDVVQAWRDYRRKSRMSYEDVDEAFVSMMSLDYPDVKFSRNILYRKYNAYINNDLIGLVDKRGKSNLGRTKITPEIRGAYQFYYLNESQYPYAKCYEYMKMAIAEDYPEQMVLIPSERTMRRDLIRQLPKQLRVLGRQGKKAYDDIAGFFIRRDYEAMASNDWWIGDTHTLDIQSVDKNGKLHRLHFSSWMDARSGVMVGWYLSPSSSSQATLMALRNAIQRRGNTLPRNVYVDNGREFLNHDIGGMGHRARKNVKNKRPFTPPPVFARMGIKMTNALVRNARAKIIERCYRDIKDHVSRLFGSYTGGNVLEKPERLGKLIKDGKIINDEQLIAELNDIIEYYFNYEAYGGSVDADKGLSKLEVYNKYLDTARKATSSDLELMLLRSSRPIKVGRRGLSLKIGGEKLDYYSDMLRDGYFDKMVYYRYDPEDLSEIRVYDENDRYIMNVPCADDTVLTYNASKEEVAAAQKKIRNIAKRDAEAVQAIKSMGFKAAKDLVLAQALRKKANPLPAPSPKVIEIQRADEQVSEYAEMLKAVNSGTDTVDLDRMLNNIKKKKGGTDETTV